MTVRVLCVWERRRGGGVGGVESCVNLYQLVWVGVGGCEHVPGTLEFMAMLSLAVCCFISMPPQLYSQQAPVVHFNTQPTLCKLHAKCLLYANLPMHPCQIIVRPMHTHPVKLMRLLIPQHCCST